MIGVYPWAFAGQHAASSNTPIMLQIANKMRSRHPSRGLDELAQSPARKGGAGVAEDAGEPDGRRRGSLGGELAAAMLMRHCGP